MITSWSDWRRATSSATSSWARWTVYRSHATRLLWEQIHYVGEELRRWARRNKCRARLQGFSTHYNISFQTEHASRERDARRLGYLLAHVLAAPVMLLAANKKSSAVGVRPRGKRIE